MNLIKKEITKKEWEKDFSHQFVCGNNFMLRPSDVRYKKGLPPTFSYVFFESFGSLKEKTTQCYQIDVTVIDWLDFDKKHFKTQLEEDTKLRLKLCKTLWA
jgi:hypothetical protein